MDDLPLEQLLTPQDVAKILRVKLPTVYSWKTRGLIVHYQLSGAVRFAKEDVRAFIESGRGKPGKLRPRKAARDS